MMAEFSKRRLTFLFQFLILFVNLDNSAGCESETEYLPCQFEDDFQPEGVTCEYKKGFDFTKDLVSIGKCPGSAKMFKVSLLPNSNNFLLNWNFPQDGSLAFLKGFVVQVNFDLNGRNIEFSRTFRIELDKDRLDYDEISQIYIRYTCIGAFPETEYRIGLTSFPRSTASVTKNVTIYTPKFSFNVTDEGLMSGDWTARMWFIVEQEEGGTSMIVCFFGAPARFSFGAYKISLVEDSKNHHVADFNVEIVNVTAAEGREICRKFTNVTDGSYKVKLLPMGPADCRCKLKTEGQDICQQACPETAMGPIDIKSPVPPKSGDLKTIIAVVLTISILLVLVIFLLLYFVRKKFFEKTKTTVLILSTGSLGPYFCPALTWRLEKSRMVASLLDLSGGVESCAGKTIEKRHMKLMVLHHRDESRGCANLGEPDTLADRAMKTLVDKVVKNHPTIENDWCIHCRQPKKDKDAKVAVMKIIDQLTKDELLHAPSMNSIVDMTFLQTLNYSPLFDSVDFVDSGFPKSMSC